MSGMASVQREDGESSHLAAVSVEKRHHKRKKLMDPAAPRPPPNCFILYMNEHREAVKMEMEAAGHGQGSVKTPMLSSEMGRRWSLLSSQDKLKYENKFKEDMKKFELAKADYKPSEEFLTKVKLREEKLDQQKVGHKACGKKSPPGMMKAYFDFVGGNWMRVALANPGLSPGEMQKEIWREWTGEGGKGVRKEKGKNVKKRARSVNEERLRNGNEGIDASGIIKERDLDASSEGSEPNSSVAADDDESNNSSSKIDATDDLGPKIDATEDLGPKIDVNSDLAHKIVANNDQSPKKVKKLCKSPPSNAPMTSIKQDYKPSRQEREETAYSFFQTQMKGELRRMCPQMKEEEMVKSVQEKWKELSEDQKEIFYKEIIQNQN